jgi:CheY-like chemotaxis protein
VTSTLRSLPAAQTRVLIADGDDDNRELYRESFTLSGWQTAEASDGREALVQALIVKPRIVVTELRLPIIDGVSLCEILRRDRATANVLIVVVTSEMRAAQLARAERAGADSVLVKPSAPDVVINEMQRLLGSAPIQRAAPALPAPGPRRTAFVKAHNRHWTTRPDVPPISLTCPICGQALRYQETFVGGVSRHHSERWDYYACVRCGHFQYRVRTRKLRHMP